MKDLRSEADHDPSEALSWYLEASLVSADHVYCSGTLAQCVRRWMRLSEAEQSVAAIKLRDKEGMTLTNERVIALTKRPDLKIH